MEHKHNTTAKSEMKIIDVFFKILRLKSLFRQGWLKRGISKDKCETVADHTFGTAMISWLLAHEYLPQLNEEKVLKLALIHEMGEILVGDITPVDGVIESDKYNLELNAVKEIFREMNDADYWIELWKEFEAEVSAESRFVKIMDRVEMGLQANWYELESGLDLQEFKNSTLNALQKDKELYRMLKGEFEKN